MTRAIPPRSSVAPPTLDRRTARTALDRASRTRHVPPVAPRSERPTRPTKTGARRLNFEGVPRRGLNPRQLPQSGARMSTRRRRASGDAEERAKSARSKSRAASSTPNAPRRGDVGRPREGGEDGRAARRGGRPLRVLYASLFVIWGAVLHHGEVYSHVVAQRRCLVAARRERDEGDGDRGPAVGGRVHVQGARQTVARARVCGSRVRCLRATDDEGRVEKICTEKRGAFWGTCSGKVHVETKTSGARCGVASTPRSGGRETAMVGRCTTPSPVTMTLVIPKSFAIIPESSHGSKNGMEKVTLSSASAALTS